MCCVRRAVWLGGTSLRVHPQRQLHQLRQYGVLLSNAEACVAPNALLSEGDAPLTPDVQGLVTFVKGVSGVHSVVGAKRCLSRLLATRFHSWLAYVTAHGDDMVTLLGPLGSSLLTEPDAAARRYAVSELALLRASWEREMQQFTGAHNATNVTGVLDVDIGRTSAQSTGLVCTSPMTTGVSVAGRCPATVCVSCADLIATTTRTALI